MKDTRSPEELILPFVTCCAKTVKKAPTIAESRHNAELNDQIRQFVQIVRETVAQVAPHLTDVLSRLDNYLSGMKPEPEEDAVSIQEPNDPMAMSAAVMRVFDIFEEADIKAKSKSLKGLCTAKVRLYQEMFECID